MKRTILVVNDSALSALLNQEYTVLEANGGAQALSMLAGMKTSISAVLLCETENAKDALWTLAEIRKDASRVQLPVLVLADITDSAFEARALALGATNCLSRTAHKDAILRRLQNAIISSESIARLQVIVSNIASGVTAISIDEQGTVEYIIVTEKFYALLGYTREEYTAEARNTFGRIHKDDVDRVRTKTLAMKREGERAVLEFRVIRRDGREIWLESVITVIHIAGIDNPVQLSVFTDITERKKAQDDLRMSEERFRIAAQISGREIGRYDIKTGIYYHENRTLASIGYGNEVHNAQQAFIESGSVMPECVQELERFFEQLKSGAKNCSVDTALRDAQGGYRWIRSEATVISDQDGNPSQAIIVLSDITEQREKEAAFERLYRSLKQRAPESFTFFRWNISKDISMYSAEGKLLNEDSYSKRTTFNERSIEYARGCVYPDDRESFLTQVKTEVLLAAFQHDKRQHILEYREMTGDGGVRWLRLTIDLVQYGQSADVEAFLMFEDINEEKTSALRARALADTDTLTGTLNRAAFIRKMEQCLLEHNATRHALMMLDLDGFKQLNDVLGHAAGDQALVDVAHSIRSILRAGDLVGRLGGDEFLVFLQNVPYDAVIEKRARQICALARKAFSADVQISASVGIAMFPDDGTSFDALYRNADAALYSVKDSGKDNYTYYNSALADAQAHYDGDELGIVARRVVSAGAKRRMLIADGDVTVRKALEGMFEGEFCIETAKDGETVLMRLKHYGTGIAVVLLDLALPGLGGFHVLDTIHERAELQSIPVIAMSSASVGADSLEALRRGAADYVEKPLDEERIRLHVYSTLSKVENERLRAQNGYLLLQSNEEIKYRTVLDSTGTVVIEYDWVNGVFTYDTSISRHIAGNYESRKLWRILLADMVADVFTVKVMQELVHDVANDRARDSGVIQVLLKTPSGAKEKFRMSVFKRSDEFRLTDKIIITFININEQALAEEKLQKQVERDELTGLYNRTTFLRKAAEIVHNKPAGAYVIAVGDIDGFKIINDRYGHAEGDRLLIHVADKLRSDMKAIDGVCGRLGGDQFAALFPNDARTLEKLHDYPRWLLLEYGIKLEASFSIGYYVIESPSLSPVGMLDRASMAKETIKRQYSVKVARYDETMRKQLLMEQDLAATMEDALRNEQFDIFLQPQFNRKTGKIYGAEALVRWLRQDKSVMFLPDDFIPLFERNGFIARLDEYVWTRVAQLLRGWIELGVHPVPISVNVSRLDIFDSSLCVRLLSILQRHGVPTRLFRLEISETLLENNAEKLAMAIGRLREAGFLVEMDDFGSGHCSLNALRDIQADVVKLDMRFFSGAKSGARSDIILNAVLRMTKWLDIPVIAEGVETARQADFLASIGCPIVQGYLYAAPMPVEQFDMLLAGNADLRQETHNNARQSAGVVSLWALGSADSELFYRYINAAMIYEYNDGLMEVLRVNQAFSRLLRLPEEDPLPSIALPATGDSSLARLREATERALKTGTEQRILFRLSQETLLSLTLRAMPGDMGHAVLICCAEECGKR